MDMKEPLGQLQCYVAFHVVGRIFPSSSKGLVELTGPCYGICIWGMILETDISNTRGYVCASKPRCARKKMDFENTCKYHMISTSTLDEYPKMFPFVQKFLSSYQRYFMEAVCKLNF